MIIEKTYKLTIKDQAFNLTEQEVSALYDACRQALNISVTNPNWPTYPLPNTYCGNVPFVTIHRTDNPVMDGGGGISTANVPSSKGINFLSDDMETIKENNNWRSSVQKALDKLSVTGTSISTANVPSSNGINFISDDMETIKDNNKWRSSVQQALDKLNAKTNITTKLNSKTNITTNDGTTIR